MMPNSAMGSCAWPLGPVYTDWTLASSSEAELSQHHEVVAWLSGPVYTVWGQKGSIWSRSSMLFYWPDRCKLAVDLGLRKVSLKMTLIEKASPISKSWMIENPKACGLRKPHVKGPHFYRVRFQTPCWGNYCLIMSLWVIQTASPWSKGLEELYSGAPRLWMSFLKYEFIWLPVQSAMRGWSGCLCCSKRKVPLITHN